MKVIAVGGAALDVITSINSQDIEQLTMHNATLAYGLVSKKQFSVR